MRVTPDSEARSINQPRPDTDGGGRTARSRRSLAYFAIFDPARGQGIGKKISGFLQAAEAEGWQTRAVLRHRAGILEHLCLGAAIARADEGVLVIRSTAHFLAVLTPFCLLARIRGRRLILDVPTPQSAALVELLKSTAPITVRVTKALALLSTAGPFVYWPFHRVIEYAAEGPWWMLGNRARIRELGNGIDLGSIPQRPRRPEWPGRTLKLIAVANVSFWHGYDRMLRAMRTFLQGANGERDVEFTLVGTGEEVDRLRSLAEELGLSDRVHFRGPLVGDDLLEAYCEHHLAVASLALHRKGLTRAAELKAREYCAVGIPFIASGDDVDFPEAVPFRFAVSLSEDDDELAALLDKLSKRSDLPDPCTIRAYAEAHLDMRLKVRQVLGDAIGR